LRNFDEYCKVSGNGCFECLHCPEVSLSVDDFKKHYKEKHLKIYYDCEKCGFSTRCFGTISDHINKYHDNDISIIKRRIYRVTSNQDDLAVRVQSVLTNSQKNLTLTSANLINNSLNSLQNRKELIIDSDSEKVDGEESEVEESEYEYKMNGTSRHQCRICQQEFTRSERVREHYDAIHLNIAYVCSLCGYTNRWKRSVIQHLRSKHDRSPPYKPLMIRKKVDNVNKSNAVTSRNDSNQVKQSNSISIKNGRVINLNKPISDDLRMSTIIDIYSEPNNLLPYNESRKSSSFLSKNHLIFNKMNDNYISNSNSNHSSPSIHLRLVWVCRKCGFSHKWKIIVTNHLRMDHHLPPPFNQYMIRRKENSSPSFLSLKQANQKLEVNNEITVKIVQPQQPQVVSKQSSKDCSQTSLLSTKPAIEILQPQSLEISKVNSSFQCKLCCKSFDTIRGLREHSDGMHKNMVWACKLCPYTDKWRPQAITHLRNKHKCKPPYSDHIRRISKLSMSITRPSPSSLQEETEDDNSVKKVKNFRIVNQNCANFDNVDVGEEEFSEVGEGEFDDNDNEDDEDEEIEDDEDRELKIDESQVALKLSSLSNDANKMSESGEEKVNLKNCYVKLSFDQYQCKLCSKICGSAQGITEHYEAYHLNMLYYCQLCDFTDVWRSMMTKHLKLKHNVCKPYDNYLKRKKIDKDEITQAETLFQIKVPTSQIVSTLNGSTSQTMIKPKVTEGRMMF